MGSKPKYPLRLLRLDYRTGVVNIKTRRRLKDIPVGIVNRKGRTPIMRGRQSISMSEYKKLMKRYGKK